ncbi:hypothetical protein HNY73_013307 [Argiope bruennichi]|uniref:Uncharacterized protein n=1 Tax=Argiope bruennichi TaxID=94029 RepID=A0A8T0F2F1_ARGBR|nr:hypothetical protein HNY73_013307 [Argiope bruennichi]
MTSGDRCTFVNQPKFRRQRYRGAVSLRPAWQPYLLHVRPACLSRVLARGGERTASSEAEELVPSRLLLWGEKKKKVTPEKKSCCDP